MWSNSIGKAFVVTCFGESHGPVVGVTIDGCPAGLPLTATDIQRALDVRIPEEKVVVSARREPDIAEIFSGVFLDHTTGAPINIHVRNRDVKSADYESLKDVVRPGHADYPAKVKYGGYSDYRGGGRLSGRAAKSEGDSVGGIVECTVFNLPVGVGEPLFDALDAELAKIIFGIPAVKGVEFGSGFKSSDLKGSENNDQYSIKEDKIVTITNNSGGVLGGMSTGMPLLFRVAFKPPSSIAKQQQTVNLSKMEETPLEVKGRHDPCVVPKAVPVVQAMVAIGVADLMIRGGMIPHVLKN